jgi:predicted nuclease of predicted toxin-antitoxin system
LKILLDHNLDRRLKNHLTGHEVSTTQSQGWADVINGELLTLLEENNIDVMITADANIKTQQNFAGRSISVVVLRAGNNRLATHLQMLEGVELALASIHNGEIVEVFHPEFR